MATPPASAATEPALFYPATPAKPTASAKPKAPAKKKPLTKAQKQAQKAEKAVQYATKQLGDRYRYGGTGPNSWDCSGLAGGSWRKAGVKLPRTTTQIYKHVKKKVSYKSLKRGDLIFFYSHRGHMGIYVGKGYMIHAPRSGKKVQKVKLSTYYRQHFNGAVRPGL
ncbi:C40 family peptidase [Thermomonospora amylolytica]|uniref:C40 family peptidase n=1 Tax=Thermomonospora amylolytica TaxID=1411117 RepID=UPI000E6D2CD6|nr:C40 family peptidase [Thermomonospora amylolytica]